MPSFVPFVRGRLLSGAAFSGRIGISLFRVPYRLLQSYPGPIFALCHQGARSVPNRLKPPNLNKSKGVRRLTQ